VEDKPEEGTGVETVDEDLLGVLVCEMPSKKIDATES
jgi:hypothetical protein